MKKFFTVRGGQIGTAHVGRDGKVVDFRPAEIRYDPESGKIIIYPPKDKEATIGPVAVDVVDVGQKVEPWTHDQQQVTPIYWGYFCGVKVEAFGITKVVWANKEAEEAARAAIVAKFQKYEEDRRRVAEFFGSFDASRFAEVIGKRGASRVYRGKVDIVFIAKSEAVKASYEKFGFARGWVWYEAGNAVSRVGEGAIKSAVFGGISFRRIMGTADWMEKFVCA